MCNASPARRCQPVTRPSAARSRRRRRPTPEVGLSPAVQQRRSLHGPGRTDPQRAKQPRLCSTTSSTTASARACWWMDLLKAADRGFGVRILLDDTTSDGLDWIIATLAAHPQIQIRRSTPCTVLLHRRDAGHGPAVQPFATPAHAQQVVAGGQQRRHRRRSQPGRRVFRCRTEPRNFTDIDMLSVGPVAEQLGHKASTSTGTARAQQADRRIPVEQAHTKGPAKYPYALEESLEETRNRIMRCINN